MVWTKLAANGSVGLEAQWLFKACNAPLCSLKPGETSNTWVASLLNRTGLSAVVMHTTAPTVEQAQRDCEKGLREMGWDWSESSSATATG